VKEAKQKESKREAEGGTEKERQRDRCRLALMRCSGVRTFSTLRTQSDGPASPSSAIAWVLATSFLLFYQCVSRGGVWVWNVIMTCESRRGGGIDGSGDRTGTCHTRCRCGAARNRSVLVSLSLSLSLSLASALTLRGQFRAQRTS
jgi:hypothetical protein